MSLKSEKMHSYFTEKALDYAIFDLIGPWGEYYIDDRRILFRVKNEKIGLLEKLHFNLPSWDEVATLAKTKYKNFDDSVATKIVYEFSYLTEEKDLIVSAKNSDIVLGNNNFTNLVINDANDVKIYSDTLENGGINITAKNIEFINIQSSINRDINLTAKFTLFYHSHIICLKNININSELLEFYISEIMYSDNLNLKSDLIVSTHSELRAKNKIEITNANCDEIKGVNAPLVIYNGQNISYSEGIVMPKLRKNLIEVLYKIKHKVSGALDSELEEKTKKIKQELNNKPIVKMLKK